MASISTADFKNGMCIINNGKMCTIVEFQHVKPGKGGAFVRTKLKDIKTGRVVDYTFNAGTKFDSVRLESKKMQYLYNDGADYWFMDNSTFEQMPVSADMVGSAADWLKENDEATLLYAGDELISLEPQMFVELEVTHTEPGFKGDTATNTLKPATLETGKEVQVPTFIEIGDVPADRHPRRPRHQARLAQASIPQVGRPLSRGLLFCPSGADPLFCSA